MHRHLFIPTLLAALLGCAFAAGCSDHFNSHGQPDLSEPKVEAFFNSTGTRSGNRYDLKPSEFLVERIDGADATLDVATYGFDKQNVVDAVVRAYDRGVDVRFVGSTSHVHEAGYQAVMDREIPSQIGNEFHIMHEKFFIIDNRFVFAGTGNITPTGFTRNNNNWVWFESQPAARDFTAEFERMFNGRFSTAKDSTQAEHTGGSEPDDPAANETNTYEIGDTTVELYFAPREPAMTRLLEEVEKAHTSVHFQIFAFTKDELGSTMIRKHRKFMEYNAGQADLEDGWREDSPRSWPKKVVGLLDRSQVHGNGQWHEAYRMEAFGIPMKIDANENSRQPGDYQAGGGRLHTKTMIIDAGTEDARVVTGSFNWSSAASVANDEFLMILHGEEIAERYMSMYDNLWTNSRQLPGGLCNYLQAKHDDNVDLRCPSEVEPQDVVFSEVQWDGWNGEDDPTEHVGAEENRAKVTNDHFIELHNTTDDPIDMSLWTITNGEDFIMGFPPGTIIRPDQHYLVLDHNTVTYSERRPQRGNHAFRNGDFVLNTINDPRYPRLNLKNATLRLELRKVGAEPSDPSIDVAGDGGPPFYGGREIECTSDEQTCEEGGEEADYEILSNKSMERIIPEDGEIPPGDEVDSWQACRRDEGGDNVNPRFRDRVIATPGAPNSE